MSRALLLAALLPWAACGYTVGTGLSARGIRTVAFQVVGNESYRQRLEVEINRFLSRELPVTTDLQLARRRRLGGGSPDVDAKAQPIRRK